VFNSDIANWNVCDATRVFQPSCNTTITTSSKHYFVYYYTSANTTSSTTTVWPSLQTLLRILLFATPKRGSVNVRLKKLCLTFLKLKMSNSNLSLFLSHTAPFFNYLLISIPTIRTLCLPWHVCPTNRDRPSVSLGIRRSHNLQYRSTPRSDKPIYFARPPPFLLFLLIPHLSAIQIPCEKAVVRESIQNVIFRSPFQAIDTPRLLPHPISHSSRQSLPDIPGRHKYRQLMERAVRSE
jgi:hypothetical protein